MKVGSIPTGGTIFQGDFDMTTQVIYLDVDDILDLQNLLLREGKENILKVKLESTDLTDTHASLKMSYKLINEGK